MGRKLLLTILLSLLFIGCAEVGYQPPLIPVRISINQYGQVSISSSYSFNTPVGTFDLTTEFSVSNIRRDTDYPILIVHVDDMATVYKLSPDNTFDVSFDGDNRLYRKVSLQRELDGDIILELKSVEAPNQPTASAVSAFDTNEWREAEGSGLPILDDASEISANDHVVSYYTSESSENIAKFYDNALTKSGYILDEDDLYIVNDRGGEFRYSNTENRVAVLFKADRIDPASNLMMVRVDFLEPLSQVVSSTTYGWKVAIDSGLPVLDDAIGISADDDFVFYYTNVAIEDILAFYNNTMIELGYMLDESDFEFSEDMGRAKYVDTDGSIILWVVEEMDYDLIIVKVDVLR